MNRIMSRKGIKKIRGKVGKLHAARQELYNTICPKKYKSALKTCQRLEKELLQIGVLRHPTPIQIFWGRTKATIRALNPWR